MLHINKISMPIRLLALGIISWALLPLSASAQSSSIPSYEFRQMLLEYSGALNTCGVTNDLGLDIQSLTEEQIEAFSQSIPDSGSFANALSTLVNACTSTDWGSDLGFEFNAQASIISESYPPDYPSGGSYDVFIATLPGLGVLDNGTQNRTDPSAVGAAWITLEAFRVAAIVAQGVCDAAPSGDIVVTNTALCPPSAVAWGLVQSTQIVIDQAAFQDGLIDNAEIEAAYENSKKLLDNTVELSVDIAAHDTAISNQLTQHDTDISNQLTQHDTDISNQLTQHDTDIKSEARPD